MSLTERQKNLLAPLPFVVVVVAFVFSRFVGGEAPVSRRPPPEVREHLEALAKGPEALQWLTASTHPAALASNRFGSTLDAMGFAGELYELGARRVVVDPRAIRRNELGPGAHYADVLLVALPDGAGADHPVVRTLRAEAARESLVLGPEVEFGLVYMWWD